MKKRGMPPYHRKEKRKWNGELFKRPPKKRPVIIPFPTPQEGPPKAA